LQHGRYFVSLHDFRLCCPEPHLLTRGNRFCDGQGCAASCRHEQDSIDHLRSTSSQVLQNAHAVIHFSQSTKNHFAAIMGEDYNWKLIEHGVDLSTTRNSSIGCGGSLSRPSADRPLKVAFLGGLGPHKGFHLVQRIVKHRTLPSGIPVEWHVIGMTSGELRDRPHIIKHGRYARKELPAIMREISPDLVAILSICPETYCFTLDEALMCGVPIISTPLGAPADRVQRDQCGWVLEALELETIFEKLQWVVDSWNTSYREVRRRIPTISLRDVRTVGKAYDQLYHDACRGRKSVNITRRMHLLEKLASRAAYEIPWRRLLIGRALNECESLLYKLGIRSLAQKVVRQLLPHRMQCAIQNLRRLPVTSEERHGRFHDDARAA
jgi:glycosyltransferase involved in cell wall biosynthesis